MEFAAKLVWASVFTLPCTTVKVSDCSYTCSHKDANQWLKAGSKDYVLWTTAGIATLAWPWGVNKWLVSAKVHYKPSA